MENNVDIIVNCFNGEKYLSEALDSILSQDYPLWRIIFIDNCSSDSSKKIAQNFEGNLIYHRTEKKISLGAARKLAVSLTKSDYIAFLDCDDRWLPNKLKEQVEIMQKKELALTFSGINYIDQNGKYIGKYTPISQEGDLFREKLVNFDINILTSLIRREFLMKNDLNFSSEMEASEEYNLFMQIAAIGKIHSTEKIHADYRILEDSLTNKFKKKWAEEREITINHIIKGNHNFALEYEEEIKLALNRACYYKACFYMENKKYSKARKELINISKEEYLYLLFYLLSLTPILWKLFHRRKIKEKLTRVFFKKK